MIEESDDLELLLMDVKIILRLDLVDMLELKIIVPDEMFTLHHPLSEQKWEGKIGDKLTTGSLSDSTPIGLLQKLSKTVTLNSLGWSFIFVMRNGIQTSLAYLRNMHRYPTMSVMITKLSEILNCKVDLERSKNYRLIFTVQNTKSFLFHHPMCRDRIFFYVRERRRKIMMSNLL